MQIYKRLIHKSDRPADKERPHTLNRSPGIVKKIFPVLLIILLLIALPAAAQQQGQTFDTWDPTDKDMKTGPDIGEVIPDFEAEDQNGKLTSFKDIVGPNGALILFHRSADW